MKSLLNHLFSSFIDNSIDNKVQPKAKKPSIKFKSQVKAGGADGTVYYNADGSGTLTNADGSGSVTNAADGTVYLN